MNARCRGVFAVEKVLNPTAILEQLVVYKDGLATYVIDVQFVDNIKAVHASTERAISYMTGVYARESMSRGF